MICLLIYRYGHDGCQSPNTGRYLPRTNTVPTFVMPATPARRRLAGMLRVTLAPGTRRHIDEIIAAAMPTDIWSLGNAHPFVARQMMGSLISVFERLQTLFESDLAAGVFVPNDIHLVLYVRTDVACPCSSTTEGVWACATSLLSTADG